MPWMAFLILTMIFSTAVATFIENDFGPAAARAAVYNTRWFEILLAFIIINLAGNMIKGKLYRKKKLSIFLFHFAFLFMFIGAAVTRYVSYEGTMHIREGSSSGQIISSGSFLYVSVDNGSERTELFRGTNFIPGKKNKLSLRLKSGDEKLKLKLLKYVPNAERSVMADPSGEAYISLVSLGINGRQSHSLKTKQSERISGLLVGFNNKEAAFNIINKEEGLFFISESEVLLMDMTSNEQSTLAAGELHPFLKRRLYTIDKLQLVLTAYLNKGREDWFTMPDDGKLRPDAIILKAKYKSQSQTLTCFGSKGRKGNIYEYEMEGVKISLSYGSRWIQLPFSLYLKDFKLERYPGSNSPASYASEVMLIDDENGIKQSYNIFMNNILNYKGFRFFQSSYDTDEKGTILSVNHDAAGTAITYFGYFLMTMGMLLSIFNKNSRFMQLARSGSKQGGKGSVSMILLIIVFGSFSSSLNARDVDDKMTELINTEQAEMLSHILVQDQGGRIKPLQSMASDVLRKVSKKESLSGLNPVQVVMGMYLFPEYWQRTDMIKVSNGDIRKLLGISDSYASYIDFIDMNSRRGYKLAGPVQQAYKKKPGSRTKFDQEIMKVDERFNVCYMVFSGSLLKVFPAKEDADNKWYQPGNVSAMTAFEDSVFVSEVFNLYRNSLLSGGEKNKSDEIIEEIITFQQVMAGELYPAEAKISLEIFYNKANIFKKLSIFYGAVGFVLLILMLVSILGDKSFADRLIKAGSLFLLLGFLLHTFGLGLRWYISGHAPWSNGYESMIYIAWAAMLSGLIFVRKSTFALVAASLLAALTLLIAHMSWMNPEITNLVPVLKSYWLTIHVSVITASYGFLGTAMVLGLFSLILYAGKTADNHKKLQSQIVVLSDINEMALILGVYFISIGTFLGAVWANESWGRYWGWDPKETWAMITALVYIFISHMRYIPGLRGHFALNLASVIGFFSVLMTYFGVNYYLAGLHSYAQGDAVPVPAFVYYSLAALALIIFLAWYKERKYSGFNDLSGSR